MKREKNYKVSGSIPEKRKNSVILPICYALVKKLYLIPGWRSQVPSGIVEVRLSWSRHHCLKKRYIPAIV